MADDDLTRDLMEESDEAVAKLEWNARAMGLLLIPRWTTDKAVELSDR
jgi:hypothetical protein